MISGHVIPADFTERVFRNKSGAANHWLCKVKYINKFVASAHCDKPPRRGINHSPLIINHCPLAFHVFILNFAKYLRQMAENAYKSNTFSKKDPRAKNEAKKEKGGRRIFLNEPRLRLVFGFFLLLLSVYFFVAFVSYLFAGKEDQSVIEGCARAFLRRERKPPIGLDFTALCFRIFSFSDGLAFRRSSSRPCFFFLASDWFFKRT